MLKVKILISLVLLMMVSVSAIAEVTPLFNYQGKLTEPEGTPYTGIHTITLSIYDVETGGSALRSAAYSRNVKNGYFNILFGAEPTMDLSTLSFDKQYYIGVQVDGLTEMTPREKIGSVAYAMRAQTAVEAESATIAATVVDNGITEDKIANKAVTRNKIADNAIGLYQMEMFAVMPVGAIIAWYDYPGTYIPPNWVRCDGGIISDAESLINGGSIPNLNGEGRFLRGGVTAGTMQADEFESHNHQVIASWPSANRTEWHVMADWTDPDQQPVSETAPGDGPSISNSGGSETRPVNMSVVWLMKIK